MKLWGTGVFLIMLGATSCATKTISSFSSSNTKVDSGVEAHAVDSLVQPYRLQLVAQMAEVIGYADSSLLVYSPESPLGNFAADVVFEAGFDYSKSNAICSDSNSIFCMLNFGGLRTSLNKGEITRGDIYELMPFDNSITIVKIRIDSLYALLNYMLAFKGQPVSNIRMRLAHDFVEFSIGNGNQTKGYANERLEKISDGPTINVVSDYIFIITSDYLANGGDRMSFFQAPIQRWDTGILVRDVLISYIKREKHIPYFPVEKRIVLE